MSSISLFDVLMLGIGVYVLIGGIRGKGRLYSTGNVKKGMEEKYQKTMRLIYTILGVLMTLNGAVSCLSSYFYSYGELPPPPKRRKRCLAGLKSTTWVRLTF